MDLGWQRARLAVKGLAASLLRDFGDFVGELLAIASLESRDFA